MAEWFGSETRKAKIFSIIDIEFDDKKSLFRDYKLIFSQFRRIEIGQNPSVKLSID